jgi:hypothetical protein
MKSKVYIQLNEGFVPMKRGRITPEDVAEILGLGRNAYRRAKRFERNKKFMDYDQAENEDMMSRLEDGEEF